MTYPDTRVDNATDTLAGMSFPDPYRWLEGTTDEVRRWQRAQADLASAHVRQWPPLERLRQLVAKFSTESKHGDQYRIVPRHAAGRWFRVRLAEGGSHEEIVVSEAPMAQGRVLFDPHVENPDHPPFISWIAPSPDGRALALGVCFDGSESNSVRLIEVSTGRMLADPPRQVLMDNWTGGAQWLPDSSGFFFAGITGAAVDFRQQVYLHQRSPTPTTTAVEIEWTEAKDYRWVVVARDGRHAVALERLVNPIPVAVAALGSGPLRWRRFVTAVKGRLPGHLVDNRYIAVTDVGAPRGRVVAIPLDAADPNDPDCWQELVCESESALQTVSIVGNTLYISELVDTYARVRIVSLYGEPRGEVPLPDRGALGIGWWYSMHSTLPRGHSEQFLFIFSSLTVSPGIYRHTPGEQTLETLQEPQVRLDNTVVEDHWARSADGTRIPYHLVRRADVDATHPQPTLLYAYGGFNYPLVTQFPGPMAAVIAVGGVYVHAHLRGGSEFGLDWSRGGRMANKQRCYEDLYAVAEDLIATNRCTPQLLAMTGRSLGGQLAGVAATQRPELWRVVVPRVPLLDLIGVCRDASYGRMAVTMELANVEDPEEVRRLATISPYHLIRDGVCYPAVYLDVGDTDPRCAAWHARKFAARLQRATAGAAPILLHVWENVGHGLATDKGVAVDEHTEWIAFTLRHLGISDWR